jgi:MFS family permease
MQRSQINFLFLNIGHFLDHFFVLVFATVAALRLTTEWGLSYAELIPYATPGFIAFGLFAIPAGWLADKWSRPAMIVVFFIGIGISGSLAGMANNPTQMALALTLVGMFAAIYHPVGLSMVVEGRTNTGIPLAVNGIFGNMGAAAAALLAGFLIDAVSWRSAYFVPGTISILIGCAFLIFLRQGGKPTEQERSDSAPSSLPPIPRKMLL